MGGMSLADFKKKAKQKNSTSDTMKWKPKTVVLLHGPTGIHQREIHYFPVWKEIEVKDSKGKKGKKKFQVVKNFVICPGSDRCAICQLKSGVKDSDLDDDEVILTIGEGKAEEEYLKGDILHLEGFDWQRRISPRSEFIFGAIPVDNPTPPQVLVAPKSLGEAIEKVISNQQEDEGMDEGDPFQNPYGFKLVYDEKALPADMYDAHYFRVKMDKKFKKLLDSDGLDLEAYLKPTSPKEIVEMVRDALAIDPDDIDLDLDSLEKMKSSDGKKSKSSKKKRIDDDEDDEEDEDEEDEDEDERPPRRKKSSSKKSSKKRRK